MRSTKVIHVVSCDAEGEVGDVILGGGQPPPGEMIWEQSRFIARDETLAGARALGTLNSWSDASELRRGRWRNRRLAPRCC